MIGTSLSRTPLNESHILLSSCILRAYAKLLHPEKRKKKTLLSSPSEKCVGIGEKDRYEHGRLMSLEEIKKALLASYETDGGINHLDGTNLPDQETVGRLAADFMHLLFPGFFEPQALTKAQVPAITEERLFMRSFSLYLLPISFG